MREGPGGHSEQDRGSSVAGGGTCMLIHMHVTDCRNWVDSRLNAVLELNTKGENLVFSPEYFLEVQDFPSIMAQYTRFSREKNSAKLTGKSSTITLNPKQHHEGKRGNSRNPEDWLYVTRRDT